jgi:hypothetical protein
MADVSCSDDCAWTGIVGSCFLNSGQVIGFSALAVLRDLATYGIRRITEENCPAYDHTYHIKDIRIRRSWVASGF